MPKKRKKAMPPKNIYANKPWVSNYPALKSWLDKHRGRCLWQLPNGGTHEDPKCYVEGWLINMQICVIVVYSDQHGYDIYTSTNTNELALTIRDAEQRLGLA